MPGALFIGGVQRIPDTYTPAGNFDSANTLYFGKIPVTNGTLAGAFGGFPGEARFSGLTIQKPSPGPYVKSFSPVGGAVPSNAVVVVELYDYITQVVSDSIHLSFNNLPVTPSIDKPAGSIVTTVSYDPPGDLDAGSINTVMIMFSDNSNPPRTQTVFRLSLA
ncbi:MAG: hypothetical protein M1608_16160 [Candidatus Omnitrophica bacterium]|nr:hypothetical protein [Candidatus Omnitrophota bacterium]